METSYPYNMVILRRFYSNHTLLDDVNAALELDYTLKAELSKLAVEKPEYDANLAFESNSRLDVKIAVNESQEQSKIYDSISTVLWQKVLTMATANTEFNLLSGFDWAIVIGIIVTGINTIVIEYLCMRTKTISMLLVGVRIVKADFIFSQAVTSPSTVKPNMISADMILGQ